MKIISCITEQRVIRKDSRFGTANGRRVPHPRAHCTQHDGATSPKLHLRCLADSTCFRESTRAAAKAHQMGHSDELGRLTRRSETFLGEEESLRSRGVTLEVQRDPYLRASYE